MRVSACSLLMSRYFNSLATRYVTMPNPRLLQMKKHFISFHFILFYSILFYSILFYSILFYSILFYAMLCYAMLCYAILFYSIFILFYFRELKSTIEKLEAQVQREVGNLERNIRELNKETAILEKMENDARKLW